MTEQLSVEGVGWREIEEEAGISCVKVVEKALLTR